MFIGLLSDTHINSPEETLPPQIKDAFNGVDLILHAGDIWVPSVLDELESIAPVMAAWGDDDMVADLGGDNRMIKGHTLRLEGITLWLTHVLVLIDHRITILENPPDVVVSGHTHFPKVEQHKDTLLVNPGSATWPQYVQKLGTVALLTINSGEVEARIVQLK